MHSGREHNPLPVLDSLRIIVESRDDEHVTIILGDGLAKRPSSDPVLLLGVLLKGINVSDQVCVSVGVAMSEIDGVILMLENSAEGKGVEVTSVLSFHGVLVVTDVISVSLPAFAIETGFNFRVHEGFHAVVVEGVRLEEVDNVEAIDFPGDNFLDSEVVPLSVASCVVIGL